MFFVITNIYNKKNKGPTLMELFSHRKTEKVFLQLEMFDVCTTNDGCQKNLFSFPVAVNNSNLYSANVDFWVSS
jgi:hypothetical protein